MSDWLDELQNLIAEKCKENKAMAFYIVVGQKDAHWTSLFAGAMPPRHIFSHVEMCLHEDMEDKTIA